MTHSNFANNLLATILVIIATLPNPRRRVPPYVPPSNYTQPCVGTHATNGESSTQLSNNSGMVVCPSTALCMDLNQKLENPDKIVDLGSPDKIVDLGSIENENFEKDKKSFQEKKKILESFDYTNFIKLLHYERDNFKDLQNSEKAEVECENFTRAVIVYCTADNKMGKVLDNGEFDGLPHEIKKLNLSLDKVIRYIKDSDTREKRRKRCTQRYMIQFENLVNDGNRIFLEREREKVEGKRPAPKYPSFSPRYEFPRSRKRGRGSR